MKNNFEGFNYPKTSEQEVLLTLITQGYVSIIDFPYLSGFRTRVSQLQTNRGLILDRVLDKRYNKFGNAFTYAIHKLNPKNKIKAIEIYNKLNHQNDNAIKIVN